MLSSILARAAVAAGFLASSAFAGFVYGSDRNVIMYWGQGDSQIPLSQVCNDPTIDVVNLAFVDGFPTEVGEYPKTNFANACWDDYYADPKNSSQKSGLLSTCPGVGDAIKACQAANKKVLLSVGGGYPTDYYLASSDVAQWLAEFLIGAFGPVTPAWTAANKPRPFGDAVIDGFDLDLEADVWNVPSPDSIWKYYDTFINRARALQPGILISGAPQCQVPDSRFSHVIPTAAFDWLNIQFYNTAACSARLGYQQINQSSTDFSFDQWASYVQRNSQNPAVKLVFGLPAGTAGAPRAPNDYLMPDEANALVSKYHRNYPASFGGIMLWEATVSSRNIVRGQSFSYWAKAILDGTFSSKFNPTVSSSSLSSSSTRVSSSTSAAGSTSASSSSLSSSITSSTVASLSTTRSTLVSSSAASSASVASYSTSSSISISITASSLVVTSSVASSTRASSSSSSSYSASKASSTSPSYLGASSSVASSTRTSYSISSPTRASSLVASSSSVSSTRTSLSTASSAPVSYSGASSTASSISVSLYSVSSSTTKLSSSSKTSVISSSMPYYTTIKKEGVNPSSSANPTLSYSGVYSYAQGSAQSSSSRVSGSSTAVYSVMAKSSSTPCPFSDASSRTSSVVYPVTSAPYSQAAVSTPCSTASSQYSTQNQYSLQRQYSAQKQYSMPSQYSVPSQYSAPSQYSVSSQYSMPSQYSVQSPAYNGYSAGSNYNAASVTESPVYGYGISPSSTITTTITTTYVDVCETGLTTKTAYVTKTVCLACVKPTETPECPEGWTTSIYADKTTTLTITKPITITNAPYTPSYPTVLTQLNSPPSGYAVSDAQYNGPSVTSTKVITLTKVAVPYSPVPNAPSAIPYTPVPNAPSAISYTPIPNAPLAVSYTPVPNAPSAVSYSAVPYSAVKNATTTAVPQATSRPSSKPASYTPAEFLGAASRMGMGMDMTIVLAIISGYLFL